MPQANLKLNGLQLDLPAWEAEARYTGAKNIRFSRGFAERVKGDSILYSAQSTEDVIEYAVNSFDASGNYWLAAGENEVVVTDGTTWKTITPASFVTATENNTWTGGVLNGVPFLNCVDEEVGYYWDKVFGTPNLMQDLPNSPDVKAMRPYRNFLVGMDTSNDAGTSWDNTEETVAWSAEAAANSIPATWIPATDNLAGSFQLGATTGPVIDGIQLRNDFIIGKSDGIHVMTFVGVPLVMAQRQLWGKSGILARNCLAEFEGKVYILANNDFLVTDGTNITSIADNKIRRHVFEQLAADPARSFCAVSPTTREVWFCPLLVSATKYPDQIFTYDIDTGEWGHRYIYLTDAATRSEVAFAVDGVNSTTATDSWDGGDAIDWDDETSLIWNYAVTSPPTKAMVWVHPDNNTAGTTGALMVADGETDTRDARIQRDGIQLAGDGVATVRRVWLDAELPSGASISVRVGARYSDSEGYTYAPTVTYSSTDRYASVMAKGRDFSVILESDGSDLWSVQRIGLEAVEAGGRF